MKRAIWACGLSLIAAGFGVLCGALLIDLGQVGLYLPVTIVVVLAAWYGGIGPALCRGNRRVRVRGAA